MSFGELVLLVGDISSPLIPGPFKSMLVPKRMQHVLCTGNACRQQGKKRSYKDLNVVGVQGITLCGYLAGGLIQYIEIEKTTLTIWTIFTF